MSFVVELPSGGMFDILHPDPELIRISDIAWSLSRQCRFNGNCNRFYSVADHSVYVGMLLPANIRIYGLLHDAHEMIMGDIITPVKRIFGDKFLEQIRAISFGIDMAIWEAIGVPIPDQDILSSVEIADRSLAVRIEAYHLLPSRGSWAGDPDELNPLQYPPLPFSTSFDDSAALWKSEVSVWKMWTKPEQGKANLLEKARHRGGKNR